MEPAILFLRIFATAVVILVVNYFFISTMSDEFFHKHPYFEGLMILLVSSSLSFGIISLIGFIWTVGR